MQLNFDLAHSQFTVIPPYHESIRKRFRHDIDILASDTEFPQIRLHVSSATRLQNVKIVLANIRTGHHNRLNLYVRPLLCLFHRVRDCALIFL